MRRQNRRSGTRSVPETTRPDEVLMVIGIVETSVRDGLCGAWRVNKTTATCIDTHVIHMSAVDPEEHEITRR